MIRSSRLARWAFTVLAIVAGSASLPATDLYVEGLNAATQKSVFGKIDSSTGVYTEISSDIPFGKPNVYGLAWNPAIGQFNLLTDSGDLRTISLTGAVSQVIANIGITLGTLAYNANNSTMYVASGSKLATLNTSTGATVNIGNPGADSISGGSTFQAGTLYATKELGFPPPGQNNFGTLNTSTAAYTSLSGGSIFKDMRLASDGTTIYGYASGTQTLYSINPTNGALTTLFNVSGVAASETFKSMSAIVNVPEPSTYALAAIATGVMAAIARRRKARQG